MKNWNQRESANKGVIVYWAPEFVERMDEVAARLGLRRNGFIKQAVLKELERQEAKIKK